MNNYSIQKDLNLFLNGHNHLTIWTAFKTQLYIILQKYHIMISQERIQDIEMWAPNQSHPAYITKMKLSFLCNILKTNKFKPPPHLSESFV